MNGDNDAHDDDGGELFKDTPKNYFPFNHVGYLCVQLSFRLILKPGLLMGLTESSIPVRQPNLFS